MICLTADTSLYLSVYQSLSLPPLSSHLFIPIHSRIYDICLFYQPVALCAAQRLPRAVFVQTMNLGEHAHTP